MKKIALVFLITIVLLGGAAVLAIVDIWRYADQPLADDASPIVVNIRPGQSLKATATALHQAGVIESPFRFILIARLKKYDTNLKAGEYPLSKAMSPKEILTTMVKGAVKLYKLTIPEGYNIYQIADLVAATGLGIQSDFIRAATDTNFVHKIGLNADTFEGYLFPDTYLFPKDVGPNSIVSTMVSRFKSVFNLKWEARAKELGFSVHQVVTLASIIEKETGAAFERPIISSVFHNRLNKRMRLESDPTVIYGIKNFDGNLTRKHLSTPTPYNTYKIRGLPPGPIANPGRESLKAALYPVDTAFLYFVAKKDRTHHFSTNLREHNRAVRQYQLGRK